MKKILFIESGSGYGGSSKCLFLLLKYFNTDSVEPSVLYYNFGPNIGSIQKLNVKTKKYSFITAFLSIFHSDLVYINNEIYSHFLNIIFARILHKRCICHVRIVRALTRGEKFLSKWVDRFVAVSNLCKDILVREGIPSEKIEVIYDGVEQESVSNKNLNNLNLKIGVVSRIVPKKGHFTFVCAVDILIRKGIDVNFLIFGDDTDAKKITFSKLSKMVYEKHLEGAINFMGWQADTQAIYEKIDIVVCPSELQESFGMNVAEAMVFKKSVIASKVGAYSELIQDGVNGLLFVPGDENDLAKKIELLLTDQGLRERLSQKAYKTAREKFDIKTNVAKIEQLIDEEVA